MVDATTTLYYLKGTEVMLGDDAFTVIHATIAYFDRVSVKDLV
jgi:hypothetical protein